MAHFGAKSPIRTHRILDTAHLQFSILHPNCTPVQSSFVRERIY